jgi:hypothetical protein
MERRTYVVSCPRTFIVSVIAKDFVVLIIGIFLVQG